MAQAPSPNMGIIWPSDGDDANAWAPIMDLAVRGVIDGHTHAPGSGVQISMSSLKVDADISWAFGGSQRAITDLRAIDFSPQPASGVSALAGALFLNSADNELYYRTLAGANVKVTNGSALNFAAFVGGIGGDYQAVGALEIFDDGSDAYWFQQQVGAAVRQYAKMRSSDLALFEFRAVGVTPVPTQAVTLKSPAALAGNYALTMPAALPAGATLMVVDNTGAITVATNPTLAANASIVLSGTGRVEHGTKTLSMHGSVFSAGTTSGTTNYNTSQGLAFTLGAGQQCLAPVILPVGARILAVRTFIRDNSATPTKITASLSSLTNAAVLTTIASSAQSTGANTNQTLTITPAATAIASNTGYAIALTVNNGDTCLVYAAEVDYDQP